MTIYQSDSRGLFDIETAVESDRVLWHGFRMDRRSVIQTLRAHQPELRAAGIVHLRLFGSVARGNSSTNSDVDLMADFESSKHFSLVSMAHLENHLSDLLGVKVDLSPADSMKEVVHKEAVRESIVAF
jgi:predicted nucleotidyltransferase